MNRGRIQAQGRNLEESESWAQDNIPTKADGHDLATSLKGKLTRNQLRVRTLPFQKVSRFIDQAPANGYDCPVFASYTPMPPQGSERVDLEIRSGKAFRNNPQIQQQ